MRSICKSDLLTLLARCADWLSERKSLCKRPPRSRSPTAHGGTCKCHLSLACTLLSALFIAPSLALRLELGHPSLLIHKCSPVLSELLSDAVFIVKLMLAVQTRATAPCYENAQVRKYCLSPLLFYI